jgi:hypothetical protein
MCTSSLQSARNKALDGGPLSIVVNQAAISPAVIFLACVLAFIGAGAGAGIGSAFALDEGEATKVGGELTRYGEKLAVVRNANAKVLAAAPQALSDLSTAWQRVAAAPSTRGFGAELTFTGIALAALALTAFGVRRATARLRAACGNDPVPARGAAGILGLDALDRIGVAAVAYLLIEFWCDIDTTNDLVAVALLWAFVRWWISLLLVQALLRPRQPQFRLLAMSDATARRPGRGRGAEVGIAGISVMPVPLRAQMPIESAQSSCLYRASSLLGRPAGASDSPPARISRRRGRRTWESCGLRAVSSRSSQSGSLGRSAHCC